MWTRRDVESDFRDRFKGGGGECSTPYVKKVLDRIIILVLSCSELFQWSQLRKVNSTEQKLLEGNFAPGRELISGPMLSCFGS